MSEFHNSRDDEVDPRGIRVAFGLARDDGVTSSGSPRDMLSVALVSERGAYRIAGPPRS